MPTLPSKADAIVVGGGILGASTAYHLAKAGLENVVLLERRQLSCGTTWHSVGSVGQVRGTQFLTDLSTRTARMLRDIEEETGFHTGYKKVGSIMLALDEERLMEMKRTVASARTYDLEAAMLSREEVEERAPFAKTDDVLGGMYLADDGGTNPIDTVNALAKAARNRGVQILEETEVLEFLTTERGIAGVATQAGEVMSDTVVLCAGIWGRELARKAGVHVPLLAAEHFYAVTEPIASLDPKMPMIRVPDERTYYKNDTGKLLFGCFEAEAKPWGLDGIPKDFCFDSLPEDFDHFEPILEKACNRMPMLNEAGIQLFFNGPEAFTPDGEFHVGETPEVKGLYTVGGMNSVGVMTSGGAGELIARIVVGAAGDLDYSRNDVARNQPFQTNRRYLEDRTKESVGVLYGLQFPKRQYRRGRNVRRSPIHDRLLSARACMEEHAGWERPAVFAPSGEEATLVDSYTTPNWLPWVSRECSLLASGPVIADSTACAKFEIRASRRVEAWLRTLEPLDVVGEPSLRAVLSADRRIRFVLSAVQLSPERVLVLADGREQARLGAYLRQAFDGEPVFDATSAYAVFDLAGFERLSSKTLDGAAGERQLPATLPAMEVEAGMAYASLTRISHAGRSLERLFVPTEFAVGAWEGLLAEEETASLVGARALETLATVMGVPGWLRDYGPGQPLAELRPDAEGTNLLTVVVEDTSAPLWGGEPVLSGEEIVGRIASAGYDPSRNRQVALMRRRAGSKLDRDNIAVLLGGERIGATVSV